MANQRVTVQRGFRASRVKTRRGFSLVEVVMAIGMVSFGLLAILGTLPVGLKSVQDSQAQEATARITQHVRSVLQQISFGKDAWNPNSTQTAEAYDITTLGDQTLYYTPQGSACESTAANVYYKVNFVAAAADVDANTTYQPLSARKVSVTLQYPITAPEANRHATKFSLFVAKQRND